MAFRQVQSKISFYLYLPYRAPSFAAAKEPNYLQRSRLSHSVLCISVKGILTMNNFVVYVRCPELVITSHRTHQCWGSYYEWRLVSGM